jgi:ethanolamine utilization protein EutP (predicted NTPase)
MKEDIYFWNHLQHLEVITLQEALIRHIDEYLVDRHYLVLPKNTLGVITKVDLPDEILDYHVSTKERWIPISYNMKRLEV